MMESIFGRRHKRILSALLMMLLSISVNAEPKQSIIVAVNHAPPYRIISGSSYSGIYIDIMKEISKRINVSFEYLNVPFARGLNMMVKGKADMMLGPNKTLEREKYMIYTKANFLRKTKVFYTAPGAAVINIYDDLLTKRIAVKRGVSYFSCFDTDDELNKIPLNEYIQGVKMVLFNRADVLIMPEQEGDYLLKEHRITLTKSPFRTTGRKSFITISKHSPAIQYQAQIEQAMKSIETDGTKNRIIQHYTQ